MSLVGVISATLAEKQLGLDAGPIVIDEVAGMIVTYLLVPMPEALLPRLAVLGAGFVAFRVFDIFKPWPVDRIQNLPCSSIEGITRQLLKAGKLVAF